MPFLIPLVMGLGGGWYATNRTTEAVSSASNGVNWTLIIIALIALYWMHKKGVF